MLRPFVTIIVFASMLCQSALYAQNDSSSASRVEFGAYAELTSRYIWRGQDYQHKPSFQPGAELTWKGFTLGAWSAVKISGEGEHEIDLYLSKEIGPFTIALWDYWSFSKTNRAKYFDYNSETTSHMLEGQLLFSTGKRATFNFLISSLFYGADPSKSIYGEVEVVKTVKRNEFKLFTGYQFKGDYYAPKSSFVNLGCSYTRYLFTNKEFNPYISLALIANPALKKTFFTVTLGI